MNADSLFDDKLELNEEALRRVLSPIETAHGLPNACYANPTVFEIERRRVFAEGWACVGFVKDVPAAGGLYPFKFAGMPLLMVRRIDGAVGVFHNVCRHRGRKLVEASINVKKAIVCPYHGWTYDLDGALIGTPHIGGLGQHSCPGFDQGSIGLCHVRSAEWFGLIFIDLSGKAEDFADYIRPVAERWRDFENIQLHHVGADCTIEFELECNWKLAVENYCEAYHLPWVHPGLNKYSPLNRHYSIVEETYSGQGSDCYAPRFPTETRAFPNAPDLPAFWQTGAEYIALYPNVLLGIHRDHFYAVLIQPYETSRTRERFEIFYYDEAVGDPSFDTARAYNRDLWRSIFVEDRAAVEGMQHGRASPEFDGGVFSPAMDVATLNFHSWIARAILYGRSPKVVVAQ